MSRSKALQYGLLAGVAVVTAGLVSQGLQSEPEVPAYDRSAFGGWTDADSDCQTTRNEVLLRDLTEVMLDPQGCRVLSGFLADPYTGERVDFTYGRSTSSAVQIDHVVALKSAWDGGAWAWTDERRRAFSNDLDNLVATKGSVNNAKGALLPSEWAPRLDDHCDYLVTVLQVVTSWEIDLPVEEDQFLSSQVDSCPTPLTQ